MNGDMPRPRLPYLSHEKTRHGRLVWYFKRDGKRIRLPNDYGSEEFKSAYDAALSGKAEEPKAILRSGTLSWLVDRYKKSGHFASLKPSTRRMRDNILKQVLATGGQTQFVRITRKHIQEGMDRRATTPHAANNFLKVMSQLFKWAEANELVKRNPVSGIEKRNDKTDGFHTWTVDEVGTFRKKHPVGTKARLALEMLLFLGLRRSDVILAGKQHIKDGVLSMRMQKTGGWVHLPIFAKLQECIDNTETGDMALLTTESRKPFSSAGSFGNWFRKKCKEAGLPDECRAHGLRKAGATIAANEGATAHELMAMFGWSRLAMAEVYTREADKMRLARGASERLARKI